MKSINKIFSVLGVSLALGLVSCVDDLNREPIDPNQITPESAQGYINQIMAKCYSGMAVSGQTGPDGSSDISGLDGGTSQYTRALFMLQEFTTDESKWIWPDAGVIDLNTNTWGNGNENIFGTYSRLYTHIAICNDFLRLVSGGMDVPADMQATVEQYKLEARALRAMSYYWVLDLFGNGGYVDETTDIGVKPIQYTRRQLYDWLVEELETLVEAFPKNEPVIYGRVGVDGVEALLARVYLNAEVYTDGQVSAWDKCSQHCENIIARHQGTGWSGTGLVPAYMYIFCGDNDEYMPGGGGVNEILWGIPYDSQYIQAYGGSMFLCAAGISNLTMALNNATMTASDYGMSAQWGCMHATEQFADKFENNPNDQRWIMWCKDTQGFSKENTDFSTFTDGYGVVKFTNLLKGNVTDPSQWNTTDNTQNWSTANGGIYDPVGGSAARAQNFPDTDLPLLRLAEVYLMYTESYIMGGAGDQAKALDYVNYVRERAGVSRWSIADITGADKEDKILDERCRELYWELTRRSDLVRHGKYSAGGDEYMWSWKGNEVNGRSIAATMDLFPIPANVIAAQPEFDQNPGY